MGTPPTSPMQRQDDPNLSGSFSVYRRIPPDGGRVEWDEQGIPTATSQNFRDRNNELSAYISHETTPDTVLSGHEGFGLVQFKLQVVRDVFAEHSKHVIICRDQE